MKPPAESDLVAVRELRTKQKLMRRIVSEVCWYIAYLVLISVVAYGNRDPKAYFVTRTMNDMFVENKYTARMRLDDVSIEARSFIMFESTRIFYLSKSDTSNCALLEVKVLL